MRFMITESQILKKESKRAKRFIIPFLINAFYKEWEQTWSLFPLGCRRTFVLSDFFSSPAVFITDQHIVCYGVPCWGQQAGASYPTCVPSQLLVHPQPPRWWDGVRSGKRVPCQLLRGKHWAFGGTADPAAGWCQGGFVLSSFLKVWADNTSLKEHRLKCFVKVLSILKYLQWIAVKNRVYANCGYSINLVSHVLQHLFM